MGIGDATQADALSRIQALQGIGMQQRAMRQAGLDMGYEDFQRQREYPQEQLIILQCYVARITNASTTKQT